MSHLVPCLSCQRHVLVSDERCPFCDVALSSAQRASAPPRLPGRRLGRAALFTFGATLIGAAACSDGSSGGNDAAKDTPADSTTDHGGGSGGSGSGGQSGSGGASGTGGSGDAGGTGGQGGRDGGIAPPYGISPLYGAPATDR
jgi:hypothetical protein